MNSIDELSNAVNLYHTELEMAMKVENKQILMLLQRSIELANRKTILIDFQQSNADPERIRRAKRVVEEAFFARANVRMELMITQRIVDAIQYKADEADADYKNKRPKKHVDK
jgi:hypothetical protein